MNPVSESYFDEYKQAIKDQNKNMRLMLETLPKHRLGWTATQQGDWAVEVAYYAHLQKKLAEARERVRVIAKVKAPKKFDEDGRWYVTWLEVAGVMATGREKGYVSQVLAQRFYNAIKPYEGYLVSDYEASKYPYNPTASVLDKPLTASQLRNASTCPRHHVSLVMGEYGNPDSDYVCPKCESELKEMEVAA